MASPSPSSDETRNELLCKDKLLVVGKSQCPYTQRAKKALADIGAKPATVDLDLRRDGDALQSSFSSVSGIKTVPQVFVDGACVGGCDDTLAALRDGSMQQRLAACGCISGT